MNLKVKNWLKFCPIITKNADVWQTIVLCFVCNVSKVNLKVFLGQECKFKILYHAKVIKNIKHNIIYYWANVKYLLNKNLLISSKNPFYTEQ